MELNKKLKAILEEVDPKQELFTEDTLKKFGDIIEERAKEKSKELVDQEKEKIYNEAVETVDSDHSQKLEEAVEKLDKDHADKFQSAVQMIDEDHSKKFEEAMKKLDEDHADKMQNAVNKIKDEKLDEQLVDSVSDYLDTYLEETVPEQGVTDKIKLERLEEIFGHLRQVCAVTDDFAQGEFSEALQEAKVKMDEQQQEINKLMLERTKLSKQIKQGEANSTLESNIEHLSESEKSYVKRYFKDADADEISEKSINEAVDAYKEDMKRKSDRTNRGQNKYRKFINEDKQKSNESDGDSQLMESYEKIIQKAK